MKKFQFVGLGALVLPLAAVPYLIHKNDSVVWKRA